MPTRPRSSDLERGAELVVAAAAWPEDRSSHAYEVPMDSRGAVNE